MTNWMRNNISISILMLCRRRDGPITYGQYVQYSTVYDRADDGCPYSRLHFLRSWPVRGHRRFQRYSPCTLFLCPVIGMLGDWQLTRYTIRIYLRVLIKIAKPLDSVTKLWQIEDSICLQKCNWEFSRKLVYPDACHAYTIGAQGKRHITTTFKSTLHVSHVKCHFN